MVGTGGCETCIALIIKCPTGVAVFHFTPGDLPSTSIGNYFTGGGTTWAGCHAIICGGNNERESNCLADWVIDAVKQSGATLDGVSGASACGVNPDGTWYDSSVPAVPPSFPNVPL